jgi:hypothetical protein
VGLVWHVRELDQGLRSTDLCNAGQTRTQGRSGDKTPAERDQPTHEAETPAHGDFRFDVRQRGLQTVRGGCDPHSRVGGSGADGP